MDILRVLLAVICVFGICCGAAQAQTDFPRVEAGLSIPVLHLRAPIADAGLGIGGQFALNATKHFGVDAESDGFPGNPQRPGDFVKRETLVGLRAGYALPEGGLFFKIRPGFIQFPKNGALQKRGLRKLDHFALDVGFFGVRYFPNHTYLRFDFGDTIINFGGQRIGNTSGTGTTRLGLTNNPQLALGFGLHF